MLGTSIKCFMVEHFEKTFWRDTMTTILNLTQHMASKVQIEAGVVEPEDKAAVKALLTFPTLPNQEFLQVNADALALIASQSDCEAAMIGGAPYFMGPLESALREVGIRPLYAYSERRSTDHVQEDGSVRKVAVFVHLGFVG
jgi:hypothetical protein